MFKTSFYNVTFENEKQELLLVNTRTMNRLKFHSNDKERVYSILAQQETEFNKEDSLIKSLVKNEFLLPINFDEWRWVEHKQNEMIYATDFLSVTIMPTVDCNFRCIYCYETPQKNYMNEETEERVIRFFSKKIPHSKQVKISWFGGEPLLCKKSVINIMTEVDKLCKEYGVALVATMNTNGYLLDVDTFRQLVSLRVRTYEICIDGTPESHNKQRPHYKDDGSFDTIIRNLMNIKEKIKTRTFNIGMRVNMTPDTEKTLNEHIKFVAQHFAGDGRFYLSFQGVRDWGGERLQSNMILGTEKERDVQATWHDIVQKAGLKSIEAVPIIPFAGYCDANKNNGYIINFDGSIHKCTIAMYDERYKDMNKLGYIDEYGNAVIDEEKLARWIIRPTPTRENCKRCNIFPLCIDGSCSYQRNIQGNYRCNPIREMLRSQMICLDRSNKINCYKEGEA